MHIQWWIKDWRGMSDLFMYELEDNVWDEFGETDDHIVPHPGDRYGDQFGVQSDCCKKQRHEVIGVLSNSENAANYRREESSLPTLAKKDTMLEKGSWSHTPDGVFSASRDNDLVKEVTAVTSDETRVSSYCLKNENIDSMGREFCANDSIMNEKCAAVDNNSYNYSLGDISQTDNDLSFFDNDREDKESSDLLYCGWADDIGNFEDVDRMFRSCDSTFGLGSLSNEDDLCWFSSSHSNEGCEDALKWDSKFSSVETSLSNNALENHEGSRLNSAVSSVSGSKNLITSGKISSRNVAVVDQSDVGDLPFLNDSDAKSVRINKKQARHQNQSEGKRKDQILENGGSLHHNGNLKQYADTKHTFGESSQVISPPSLQQKQNLGSDSLNYMQTRMPYMHMNYTGSLAQISVCSTQSGIKSENNGYQSPSPKESSRASNRVQSMESTHGPTFEAPLATAMNEKREKLYCHQDLQPSFARNYKHANMASPAFYDPASLQKQAHKSEYEFENHNEIEGVGVGVPVEPDSLNAQESSCMSSVLEEISLEATSFRQLQQVMEQLDIRTKLCIRDSLYRLARSAEQRHNCVNSSSGKKDDRDSSGGLMDEGTNKSSGFMDMETDTNPIDRSIAHLLFHRPSDPSVMPANDMLSPKSHAMINVSITSPPVMAKEPVCQEETPNGADKSSSMSENYQSMMSAGDMHAHHLVIEEDGIAGTETRGSNPVTGRQK